MDAASTRNAGQCVRRQTPAINANRRVALIACSATKATVEEAAHHFYRGTLFRKSVRFAEKTCDEWAVLSAKHGLVLPSDRIQPYNETLYQKTPAERAAWTNRVLERIREKWCRTPCTFVFLAGARYRDGLVAQLATLPDISVEAPLQGLGIGQQLHFLTPREIHDDVIS